MTSPVAPVSTTAHETAAAWRPGYLPHSTRSSAAPLDLEDNWAGSPHIRFVLAREKRDRLVERAAAFGAQRCCSVLECDAQVMPVLLVEAELEAVLCPVHQLVLMDGSAVDGQPMLVTTAW